MVIKPQHRDAIVYRKAVSRLDNAVAFAIIVLDTISTTTNAGNSACVYRETNERDKETNKIINK